MRSHYCFLLSCTMFGLGTASAQVNTAPQSLTLCDFARLPESYNGKSIRVQAEFASGEHGSVIYDRRCPEAMLGGYKWLNYACPQGPREPGASSNVGLLWEAAELLARRRSATGNDTRLNVILVGKLEVAKVLKPRLVIEGYARGTGFCSRLDAPFRLHIERVESVTLTEAVPAAPKEGRP